MQAGYLTGFGYGMQLILYIACVKILIKRAHSRNSSLQRRNSYFLITYITILCILDTMWTGVSAFGLQSTYIDNRNYPSPGDGSPGDRVHSGKYSGGCNFALEVSNNMGAPYSRSSNLVMAFPTIMLLASIVMGVMFGIQTCSPDGLYGKVTDEFGVPYLIHTAPSHYPLTLY
ncbi:hypothetical protein BT96DRAFT_492764 [Gymnopus androsaceus JB14]|uniref:Uncharacterized protein n=1 Tax=Gymnopus androsaceus JB14 TaxID=1447944 RepID=A0A6A4GP97_9AGAR|nr:hypothetical protein BT96DRAFT_492764 [Gymnopus androsaceus JB14]